jgi:peptidoglycan/LPS O-acetylase OafA/YrhL
LLDANSRRRRWVSGTSRSAAIPGRDNGITAGRTVLALLVVVSHSFALAGQNEPLVVETGHVSLGLVAVYGFFGLSGYLLTRSRETTAVLPFLRNRALRILPGYWAALAFGAIAAAVAAGMVGQRIGATDMIGYVGSNFAFAPGSRGLPPAFGGAAVNGSLWTLGLEVVCYLVLAATPRRWIKPVAIGLIPALLAVWTVRHGFELQFGLAFLVGSCAYQLRVPVTTIGSLCALLIAAVGYATHIPPLGAMALAFAALGLARLPIRIERDLSYGIYVFAYPLSMVLALTSLADWGVGGIISGTIALVLPLAWLSWALIESKALRLRHWSPSQVAVSVSRWNRAYTIR